MFFLALRSHSSVCTSVLSVIADDRWQGNGRIPSIISVTTKGPEVYRKELTWHSANLLCPYFSFYQMHWLYLGPSIITYFYPCFKLFCPSFSVMFSNSANCAASLASAAEQGANHLPMKKQHRIVSLATKFLREAYKKLFMMEGQTPLCHDATPREMCRLLVLRQRNITPPIHTCMNR